jgi:hypothetical protein
MAVPLCPVIYWIMQENLIAYHQDAVKMTKYIQFHVT